ncbi:GNAT family N-acetyltransferase [Peptoniphilus equinus]|uniref:GNAT family N-acetyltransferase n=1 Tax=Peptoniphilus equinus TaxID=3016343 RepID=A0ABY7QVC6_9FIRM|nr:GNAT family N-acetyltransferase [Peptoniphilus equinus]WBW50205.1 GNAT family N-acetyltransferase [Peptoniphilus equinus]
MLRKATEADLDQLTALEAEAFSESYSHEMLRDLIRDPKRHCVVAEEGSVLGYILVDYTWDVTLERIAVFKAARERGIGSVLMQALPDEVAVTLEVSAHNTAALKLYHAFGFTREGVRKNYYGDGDDAYILWRNYERISF